MMASSVDNVFTDEIIRRRLQNDGDGLGDDRKLNSLVKSYISLVEGEDTEENDAASLKRFIHQIKHMEYVAKRTIDAIRVNQDAKQIYSDLKVEVQSEIQVTQSDIEKSKNMLEEATKHRKYSMEYDALAKLIESKPDRKMTEIKRMGLALELDVLKKRQAKIQDQLNHRRRTVAMLSNVIETVKDLVKSSDEKASRHRKSAKKNKKRKQKQDVAAPGPSLTLMDLDSTSQSEPPSPMDQTTTVSQEVSNGSVDQSVFSQNVTSASVSVTDPEKMKSEKYEDLSESEGDDNS